MWIERIPIIFVGLLVTFAGIRAQGKNFCYFNIVSFIPTRARHNDKFRYNDNLTQETFAQEVTVNHMLLTFVGIATMRK